MPGICLSVCLCLLATLLKNYQMDLTENVTTDVSVYNIRKNWLNFEIMRMQECFEGLFNIVR